MNGDLSLVHKSKVENTKVKSKDFRIDPDSPLAKQLGFTTDKFDGWLWKKGEFIYVSFIVSREAGRGHLSSLFDKILRIGYGIKVPTPFARMRSICVRKGFRRTTEHSDKRGNVEVWVKEKVHRPKVKSIGKIKCQICGEVATHHHKGNHFCIHHARDYARRAKWKRVMFWHTPNGAITEEGVPEAL